MGCFGERARSLQEMVSEDTRELIRHPRPCKAHMNSQTLREHAQGLPGLYKILCVYVMISSLVFMWDSCVCERAGLCFLCLLLDFYPSVGLSCPAVL